MFSSPLTRRSGLLAGAASSLVVLGWGGWSLVAPRPAPPPPPASAPVPAAAPVAAPVAVPRAARAAPLPTAAPSPPRLRIGLRALRGRSTLPLALEGRGQATALAPEARPRDLAAGEKLTLEVAGEGVRLTGDGWSLTAPALRLTAPQLRAGGHRYPDELEVSLDPQEPASLRLVNGVDLERYLEGVLPGELPPRFHLEAQRALAVAARSYALVQRGKHGEFDLCDQTCCQMYLGLQSAGPRALRAIRETKGLIQRYRAEPIYAFYSADCGGMSTAVEHVPLRDKPEGALPYLVPVRDSPAGGRDYCAASPFHQWEVRLDAEELAQRLDRRETTAVGEVLEVTVLARDPSGRVDRVVVRGTGQPPRRPEPGIEASLLPDSPRLPAVEKDVTGWQLRSAVGALRLKSTWFEVEAQPDGSFLFRGRGNGHGLGLCQIGAQGLARRGADFRRILRHYFPGTETAPWSQAASAQR